MSISPKLRRFELQVQYEPCFTFWNVKGALAELWAHGPVFDQLTDQGNQITLSSTLNQENAPEGFGGAIGGIVLSSFLWEMPPSSEDAFALSLQWIDDCLSALKPQKVVRIQALERWLSPTQNSANLEQRFSAEFSGLESELPPSGYETPFTGTTFNARQGSGPLQGTYLVGQIGILSPDVPYGFQQKFDIDNSPSLGLFLDLILKNQDGIKEPAKVMRSILGQLNDDAGHFIRTTMTRLDN